MKLFPIILKIFLGFAISLSLIAVNRFYLDADDSYSLLMDFQLFGLFLVLLLIIASLIKKVFFKKAISLSFLLIILSGLF